MACSPGLVQPLVEGRRHHWRGLPPSPPAGAGLEANQDKSKCQQQFDDYKECKKKEREARLERNKSRSLFG
ncbi:hypothetical protein SETIT_3G028700v2 [Setaria italica]|uniref:CHCH domain-containing protein n=1 Tax=Setaria italica TaxID=4555 RepID=A0A368QB11_SETIT|nr:hypothetical protein SETIT_3G028700v2 [Setaria italica]